MALSGGLGGGCLGGGGRGGKGGIGLFLLLRRKREVRGREGRCRENLRLLRRDLRGDHRGRETFEEIGWVGLD